MADTDALVPQISDNDPEIITDSPLEFDHTEPVAANVRSSLQLSKDIKWGQYTDTTRTSVKDKIFSANKAVGVTVSKVDPDGRWIEVANEAITDCNLTGWKLANNQGDIFVFPIASLAQGTKVTIVQGTGKDTDDILYTGRMSPFWSDTEDLLAIVDDRGRVAATYTYLTPGPAPSSSSVLNTPIVTSKPKKIIGSHKGLRNSDIWVSNMIQN
jgi:hypothetical protein